MKRIIALSILILTLASCGGFKHRQIVFQKEDRKQVIVENKKQESPKEFTTEKKEVKTSTIDILASANNDLEEEANNQSINFEIEYNSPSLINDQIKKDIKTLKKNKKSEPKKDLKTDREGIVAFILCVLGIILLLASPLLYGPILFFFSFGLSLAGFIIGIISVIKNKREKNKNTVWSVLSIVFGGLFMLLGLAIIIILISRIIGLIGDFGDSLLDFILD